MPMAVAEIHRQASAATDSSSARQALDAWDAFGFLHNSFSSEASLPPGLLPAFPCADVGAMSQPKSFQQLQASKPSQLPNLCSTT